jgi:hypothetical protein
MALTASEVDLLSVIEFATTFFIYFLLNRAWLGHNFVPIKTNFTKLTISFIFT